MALGRVLADARWLVGSIGERCGWWPSQFSQPVSERSLQLLFPRPYHRALLESLVAVARRAHDAALSTRSFHLFRAPAGPESCVADVMAATGFSTDPLPSDLDLLLKRADALAREAGARVSIDGVPEGPSNLGTPRRFDSTPVIGDALRHYAAAARGGRLAIPFLL